MRICRTGSLDLQNVSGDIEVTGGGGDDVRIEATKRYATRTNQRPRRSCPKSPFKCRTAVDESRCARTTLADGTGRVELTSP